MLLLALTSGCTPRNTRHRYSDIPPAAYTLTYRTPRYNFFSQEKVWEVHTYTFEKYADAVKFWQSFTPEEQKVLDVKLVYSAYLELKADSGWRGIESKERETYYCFKCNKQYRRSTPHVTQITCAMGHAPGDCCHYTETEIEK